MAPMEGTGNNPVITLDLDSTPQVYTTEQGQYGAWHANEDKCSVLHPVGGMFTSLSGTVFDYPSDRHLLKSTWQNITGHSYPRMSSDKQ